MSYEQPHCLYCRDTGKKLTGEMHSDYLDCGHCGAAQERGDMEVYANNLITINRLQPADCGLLWAVHERARDIAYAEIVRLSKERNQAEARIVSSLDAFKRIAAAQHAALVAGNGDAGEIAKLADYLNPAAVSHEAWRARAIELETTLFETLELLENTDGLSKNNVDNLAGEKAEDIRKVLYLPADSASTAGQAPIREVPEVDHLTGKWCYSRDGEEFTGPFDIEQEAHAEAKEYAEEGEHYWVGQIKHPADCIGSDRNIGDDIITHVDETAYDECGGDDRVFEFSHEQCEQLGAMVREFIRREGSVNRWAIVNSAQHAVPAAPVQKEGE